MSDILRRQYAANAVGLRAMLARAERTGQPVNGFSADTLRDRVATYERLSTATDAELAQHLASARDGVKARLAELRA